MEVEQAPLQLPPQLPGGLEHTNLEPSEDSVADGHPLTRLWGQNFQVVHGKVQNSRVVTEAEVVYKVSLRGRSHDQSHGLHIDSWVQVPASVSRAEEVGWLHQLTVPKGSWLSQNVSALLSPSQPPSCQTDSHATPPPIKNCMLIYTKRRKICPETQLIKPTIPCPPSPIHTGTKTNKYTIKKQGGIQENEMLQDLNFF